MNMARLWPERAERPSPPGYTSDPGGSGRLEPAEAMTPANVSRQPAGTDQHGEP